MIPALISLLLALNIIATPADFDNASLEQQEEWSIITTDLDI